MSSTLINRIQAKWGKFSKRRLENMNDDMSELVGMIQNAYGYSKNHAEREFHDFQLTLRSALHAGGNKSLSRKY